MAQMMWIWFKKLISESGYTGKKEWGRSRPRISRYVNFSIYGNFFSYTDAGVISETVRWFCIFITKISFSPCPSFSSVSITGSADRHFLMIFISLSIIWLLLVYRWSSERFLIRIFTIENIELGSRISLIWKNIIIICIMSAKRTSFSTPNSSLYGW